MSPEAAAAAVQEEVKNRVEQTKRQVDAKMMQGANELRNAALTVLANPSPSAPGSPPGVRSGNLRRNWNMYSSGGGGKAYSESNLECTTRDTWNMEQAKWQLVLMLKKSKKLRCRKSWHCSRN